MGATSHTRPSSARKVAGVNEELNFEFYLILIDLDLNSHTSLVVLVFDNVSLGERAKRTVGYSSNSREK